MEAQSQFGAALKRLRESRGLTQEQLAERARLTRNAIAALERGRRQRPYPHTLRALTEALDLSNTERDTLLALVNGPETPPAAQRTAFTHTLPSAPTPLLGRERDAVIVQSFFESNETRLITMIGPGGVGKTRLAIELATRMGKTFPDGVTFVALASLSDHTLIIPITAQTLGLRDAGDRPVRETLHAHLADKRVLLVLDNFEHLLQGAPEVAALLASCPSLRILATSRTPLRVRGEQEYAVEPLAVPDPARAPNVETVRAAPAVTLFVDRAQAVNTTFVLSERNAAAVAAICWRLNGLPLALELVAAQARFLGPTELLVRLDQVLQTGGARDLPARQQTMRATLDWSYALLSEREQLLFQRLAVFAGGFTLAAAEAVGTAGVVAMPDVLGLLGRLVEQSLVIVTTDVDSARYGMLEPIRQYALDQLVASGETKQVRVRHAAFYSDLAAQAETELQRSAQATWLERLQQECSNMRAAMAWLLEQGAAERVVQIGWSISRFWSFRGQVSEGLYWMEQVLDGTHLLTPAAHAQAIAVRGMLEFARGQIEQTVALLDVSVAAARAAGDETVYAVVRTLQGLATIANNNVSGAEAILTEAVALCRKQANATGIVYGLSGLAQVALIQGDIERATALNAEGEAIVRAAGDWSVLTAMLMIQAVIERTTGNLQRATALLRECVDLSTMLNDVWSIVLGATTLAGVAVACGYAEHATRLFGAVEAVSTTMGVDVSWSVWRAQRDKDIAQLRDQLDTKRFAALWAEGKTMELEQTITTLWPLLQRWSVISST